MRAKAPCARLVLGLILGVVVSCHTAVVSAQTDTSGAVWLHFGAGHSDNIRRVLISPVSGSFTAFGVQSDLDYESSRVAVDFQSDLERRNYSTSDLSDETYGFAYLDAEIDAVPDRFAWLVRDRFSQGRIDPFGVSTPENRAEVNVFSTGPRFDLPFGSRSAFRLELLKGERSVSDLIGLDGDSTDRALSYVRSLDSITELAVSITSQDIEYDLSGAEYETERAFVSYTKALASGRAYLAVGTTKTKFESESMTTPYLNLSWSRDIGARSRVGVDAVQQYVDFFSDFRIGSSSETLLNDDIYKQQLLSVSYAIDGERNSLSIGYLDTDVDYVFSTETDYSQDEFDIEFSHSLTRQGVVRVGYGIAERDYSLVSRGERFSRIRLAYEQALGRKFSLRAEYESHDNEGVREGVAIDEDVFRLSLRYAIYRDAPQSD